MPQTKTNYQRGHDAEKRTAEWLTTQGFSIVELNWRRPQCEIDIIAQKSKGRFKKVEVMYFIEVKFRSNDNQGDGFDYITPKKLKQMDFAVQMWLAENDWHHDSRMAVVAVQGSPGGFQMVELD